MHAPMTSNLNRTHQDVSDPIRCAPVSKPTEAERHKKVMMRYVILVIAFLSVLLLLAIALYYTEGNSVTIKHVRLLTPHVPLAHLS